MYRTKISLEKERVVNAKRSLNVSFQIKSMDFQIKSIDLFERSLKGLFEGSRKASDEALVLYIRGRGALCSREKRYRKESWTRHK